MLQQLGLHFGSSMPAKALYQLIFGESPRPSKSANVKGTAVPASGGMDAVKAM